MTRACTICSHSKREALERALIALEPYLRVAKRYKVSETAIRRHKEAHLFATLARSEKARDALRLERLLERVAYLDEKVDAVFTQAETAKDPGLTLKAVREARGDTELLARLLGELQEGATVNITLATSAEWVALREKIVAVLEPFPVARSALIEALKEKS